MNLHWGFEIENSQVLECVQTLDVDGCALVLERTFLQKEHCGHTQRNETGQFRSSG